MRKSKSYADTSHSQNTASPMELACESHSISDTVLELSVDATRSRRFDFNSRLGKGYDAWILAALDVFHLNLKSGSIAVRTIENWAGSGWPRWLDFLEASRGPFEPGSLSAEHVQGFVEWLKLRYPLRTSARTVYAQVRSMLEWMCERGLILKTPESLFQVNPFGRRAAPKAQPHRAFTQGEVVLLAQALKSDLIAIHQGKFGRPESDALTVSFLVIALRTGINLTPLLEASRNCLSPNPLMPNMMVLRTFKRRGGGNQVHTMRARNDGMDTSVVPMDGVAVLKSVIARTEHLVADAPPGLQDRLWLYRSNSRRNMGQILALSEDRLTSCIREFGERHHLVGDDGNPLTPSPQRLRKTVESKLWRLSDGDLIAVAAAVGHTPKVADYHYLRLTDEMKADAGRFIGLALPEILRGNDAEAKSPIPLSIRKTIQNTPVGRCANSAHGKLAPKNGVDHCDRFTECLTCPTYVIVGSVKDLHRLFSFQEFMRVEIEYMNAPGMEGWQEHRRNLIDMIDRFTSARFSASVVSAAKAMAATSPHPFWAARIRAAVNRSGGLRA